MNNRININRRRQDRFAELELIAARKMLKAIGTGALISTILWAIIATIAWGLVCLSRL